MLTLAKALNSGKLREFIAQEEARGIGPVSRKRLNAAIKALATKPPPQEDQTSHLSSGDCSTEK
jgi:hypothetical protein